MPRARNKQQLLDFGKKEYDRLLSLISKLSDKQRDTEYIFDNRTAKDIVAHLYAWQLLELGWYKEGMKGSKPAIPAEGYTFKDSSKLNEKLYQDYKDISWKDLENKFKKMHTKLLNIIESHTDAELTTKKKYSWTGSTDMACYFAAALSSHYVWAIDLIRRHFKLKV